MVTIQDIIDSLETKKNTKYNPSMEGTREAYYKGMHDAYQDVIGILQRYLKQ